MRIRAQRVQNSVQGESRRRACSLLRHTSEVHLRAELDEPGWQNAQWLLPRRSVPLVQAENRARVEQIVEIHHGPDLEPIEPDRSGDAKVDLVQAIAIHRTGLDQLDSCCPVSARRQVASQRGRNLSARYHR